MLQKTGTKHDVMRKKPSFIRKMSDNYHSYEDSEAKLPFLIIGPASILYNWLDEFDTWGHFSVGWVRTIVRYEPIGHDCSNI